MYLSGFVGLFGGALCLGGGVTEGEDDRAFVEFRHVFQNLRVKSPGNRRRT